jgi:hypothetical protein
MEEVENTGVTEQEIAESAEAVIQQDEQIVETPKPIDDRPEINWRKEMERKEERLLKELAKRDEMLERLIKQNSPQKPQEIDEVDSLAEDEFLEKRHSKKLVKKEIQPIQEEIAELKRQLQVQQSANSINQLRATHPDFDQVVNPETIALLQQSDPDLADLLGNIKDTYKMGLQTYKFIKANNLVSTNSVESRRATEIEKKLEKNSKTVQTPQAYDKRPMAQAFMMTDALKKELQDEMLRCSRLSGGY